MSRNKIASATAGVVALLSGGLGVAQSASASADPVRELNNYSRVYYSANYAGANTNHWVEACDMERDGNGVYIEGHLYDGTHFQIWDGNGSTGGCGNTTFGSGIKDFRVCEDHSGCSGYIPGP